MADITKDPPTNVEEGIPISDTKSDSGSATTQESGDTGKAAVAEAESTDAAASSSSRRILVGAGVALVLMAGIITAIVLTTTSGKDKTSSIAEQGLIDLGEEPVEPLVFPPPFGDVELPLFGDDVLETYATREALEEDLTKAAKYMANQIILQNAQYNFGHTYHSSDGHVVWGSIEAVARPVQMEEGVETEEVAMEAAISFASAGAKQASQEKIKKATAGTNNQEEDVDEADYLKTDGTYVYAAYGNYLVVWDLQGQIVAQEKMPEVELPKPQHESEWNDDGMMWADPFYGPGFSSGFVDSILLTENHVMVVVSGLGEYSDNDIGYGTKGTRVRLYNKISATQTTLELIATRDIHGFYFDSKYLESTNTIHIVSGGDFNTWNALAGPLDRYNEDFIYPKNGVSDPVEYYELATKKAAEVLIPDFVTRVADFFIDANDGQLPTFMKINSWLTEPRPEKVRPEQHFYGSNDEAFRAYLQVSTIAVDQLPLSSTDEPLPATTTALMGPSSWSHMYAAQDSVVLHMGKYVWNEVTQHSEETLFVIHLKVTSEAGLDFYGTTTMPGFIPTKRAIDIQGDDLRIATSHQKWMPLDNVWPVCGDSWYFDDSCMNEENWNDCFDVAIGCRDVVKTGCPYTFECADEEGANMESSTDNYVFVFDISKPGEMELRGRVRIGDPHEVIVGVHFGETFSYANTFDRRDPFYVLKLEQGQAPVVAGELKLDGMSSYLQPIGEDGSLVVGIGQNVTGEGLQQAPNGLLVTVFDVSDPSTPTAVASQMIGNPLEEASYSDAEFEARAVQYKDGFLAIPLTLYKHSREEMIEEWVFENTPSPEQFIDFFESGNTFEGFVVLDLRNVAQQGIKEVARIDHTKTYSNGQNCHYCNVVMTYRRSFLFDDMSLMTVYDSGVKSTDLTTGAPLWDMNITITGEDKNCCY